MGFAFWKKEKFEEDNKISTNTNSKGIAELIEIKILGSSCVKCQDLENAVVAAVEELKLNAEIKHITDFAQIAGYGVMSTPALVVNDRIVSYGKVLKKDEIKSLIVKAGQ